jgi:hypothetical protein
MPEKKREWRTYDATARSAELFSPGWKAWERCKMNSEPSRAALFSFILTIPSIPAKAVEINRIEDFSVLPIANC